MRFLRKTFTVLAGLAICFMASGDFKVLSAWAFIFIVLALIFYKLEDKGPNYPDSWEM